MGVRDGAFVLIPHAGLNACPGLASIITREASRPRWQPRLQIAQAEGCGAHPRDVWVSGDALCNQVLRENNPRRDSRLFRLDVQVAQAAWDAAHQLGRHSPDLLDGARTDGATHRRISKRRAQRRGLRAHKSARGERRICPSPLRSLPQLGDEQAGGSVQSATPTVPYQRRRLPHGIVRSRLPHDPGLRRVRRAPQPRLEVVPPVAITRRGSGIAPPVSALQAFKLSSGTAVASEDGLHGP